MTQTSRRRRRLRLRISVVWRPMGIVRILYNYTGGGKSSCKWNTIATYYVHRAMSKTKPPLSDLLLNYHAYVRQSFTDDSLHIGANFISIKFISGEKNSSDQHQSRSSLPILDTRTNFLYFLCLFRRNFAQEHNAKQHFQNY